MKRCLQTLQRKRPQININFSSTSCIFIDFGATIASNQIGKAES